MRLLVLLVLAAGACAADAAPRLVYSKYFKGSTPESVVITVEQSGAATYRDAPDDGDPLKFRVPDAAVAEMFALAARLDHFQRPIESGLKVAQMGIKTFRYENGAESHEAKFNYSLDADARALTDWFEKITDTEESLIALDRDIHFDKLGVNRSLLNLEIIYDHNRLIDPAQFFPLLERVARNESFLHIDRERAARLSEEFRRPKEKPAE